MHLASIKCYDIRRTLWLKSNRKCQNDKQVETVITNCQKLNLKNNGCLVKFPGNRLCNKLFLCYGTVVLCLMVIIKTIYKLNPYLLLTKLIFNRIVYSDFVFGCLV